MQNFLDVEGANPGLDTAINGISFLNDGKSSASIDGKKVNLTVLRSPIYAHHEPYEPEETGTCLYRSGSSSSLRWNLSSLRKMGTGVHCKTLSRQMNQKPIATFCRTIIMENGQTDSLIKVESENILF